MVGRKGVEPLTPAMSRRTNDDDYDYDYDSNDDDGGYRGFKSGGGGHESESPPAHVSADGRRKERPLVIISASFYSPSVQASIYYTH
jgi:hypothetical protein